MQIITADEPMHLVFEFIKRHSKLIIAILLVADVCYSFNQHYHAALDGDMSSIIMPSVAYQQVLKDPLGLDAFLKNQIYAAPNRFFAHYAMSLYFKNVPLWLQHFMSPVNSLYAACAIAKTLIQIAMIFLISVYISGNTKINSRDFLTAAILITPLFHVSGYYIYMGVIDHSITYTFFFALSLVYLLIYFLPVYLSILKNNVVKLSLLSRIILFGLSIVLAFNGPLIPGLVLITCPLILIYYWSNFLKNNYSDDFIKNALNALGNVPLQLIYLFAFAMILCGYSLYIGFNNAENFNAVIPVLNRYMNLPSGLFDMLTTKIGFPLLIIAIACNYYLILKNADDDFKSQINKVMLFIMVFCIIYILLLPLGGYRIYRPNIVRRDTFLPVTICMFIIFGYSSLTVMKLVKQRVNTIYASFMILLLLIFTLADKSINENTCEREAINELAASKEKIVLIKSDCNIMSWEKITDYRNSQHNAQLLYYLKITRQEQLYFSSP